MRLDFCLELGRRGGRNNKKQGWGWAWGWDGMMGWDGIALVSGGVHAAFFCSSASMSF